MYNRHCPHTTMIKRLLSNDPACDSLSLFANELDQQEFANLCHVLQSNTSCKSLNLGSMFLSDDSMDALCPVMERNQHLVELDLHYNRIGDAGMKKLCQSLTRNTSIARVNLIANPITTEGLWHIIDLLKVNTTIVIVELDCKQSEEYMEMKRLLSRNRRHRKDALATRLFSAIRSNDTESASKLLKYGIDFGLISFHTVNCAGDTLLHAAVKSQSRIMVNLFLNSGASALACNSVGQSCIDLAESLENVNIIHLLKLSLQSDEDVEQFGVNRCELEISIDDILASHSVQQPVRPAVSPQEATDLSHYDAAQELLKFVKNGDIGNSEHFLQQSDGSCSLLIDFILDSKLSNVQELITCMQLLSSDGRIWKLIQELDKAKRPLDRTTEEMIFISACHQIGKDGARVIHQFFEWNQYSVQNILEYARSVNDQSVAECCLILGKH